MKHFKNTVSFSKDGAMAYNMYGKCSQFNVNLHGLMVYVSIPYKTKAFMQQSTRKVFFCILWYNLTLEISFYKLDYFCIITFS